MKILMFSRDPGGANVIFPLIEPLRMRGHRVIIYAKDVSFQRLESLGVNPVNIMDEINDISIDELVGLLSAQKPDIIVTGTSGHDFTERFLWKAAGIAGIPSFSILDHWINYGIRFSKYTMSELDIYQKDRAFDYIPDRIFVMDEYAGDRMAEEGICRDKIVVAGHPYLEYLEKKAKLISEYDVSGYRKRYGVKGDEYLILFASEPISIVYDPPGRAGEYWGFHEKSIFTELVGSLGRLGSEAKRKVKIVIKLHPKESAEAYEDLISGELNNDIPVMVDKDSDSLISMRSSNLVCGMMSMFLIEAAYLGIPALSIQIGLKRRNGFVLDELNVMKSVLDRYTLDSRLKDAVNGSYYINRYWIKERNSVEKIIGFMEGCHGKACG